MSRSLRQPPAQDWHSLLLEAIQQRDAALAVTLAQRCVHRHGMAALDTLLERADATVEQEGDARSWLVLLLKQGSPGAAAQPGRSHPPAGGSPPSSPPLERPAATSDSDQAPTPPPPSNQASDQTLDTVATPTHDSTPADASTPALDATPAHDTTSDLDSIPAHDSTSGRASPPALDPASPESSASAFEAASAVSAFLGVDVLSPRPWAPAPEARAAAPSPAEEAVLNASWPPGTGSAPGSAFSAGHALGSDSASAHSTAADPGPAIVADTALALDTPPVHGITPAPERTPAVEEASAPERAPSPETVPAPDGPPAQAGASVSAALDQAFAPLEIAFPPLPRRDWPEVTTPAAVASPPPAPLTVPAFREPSAPLEAADPEDSAEPAVGIDLPREPEPLLEAFEEGVAAAPVPAFQGDAPPVPLEPLPSRKRRQPEAPKDQPAPVAKSLEGWRAWLPGAFRSRQRP